MKLIKMRVKEYKCVLDSNWFHIGELTCLVGKNEAGKTALLEALERLNTVQPGRADFDETEDYPRFQLSEYQEREDESTPIETEWELTDEEAANINGMLGTVILTGRIVQLSKNYKNDRKWVLPINYAAAAKYLIDEAGLSADEIAAIGEVSGTQKLKEGLASIASKTPAQQTLNDKLQSLFGAGNLMTVVIDYLNGRLPKFLYYSQYDRLPGRVSLNQFLEDKRSGQQNRDPGNKIFEALLTMVGTTPEAINGITDSESLIAQLEGVQNRLTSRIFEYWTQNKDLEIVFAFGEGLPNDPPPFNAGKVFQTRVRNNRHKVSIRLDERSTGFIWFFSFLVWFSQVTNEYGDNLIVLLDEPGLSLHARAQADLLRYMKEKLLPKYQVVYTTHSPFMIDPSDLLSCRTVEDATGPEPAREVLGTKVGDHVLSTDSDTLFPLQAALGYDITQTLFIGKHCLLVEGPSDLLYLTWFSEQLKLRNRTHLDPRWTITPCGGVTKVASFMALFGGSGLDVAVLVDYTHGEKGKVRELRESNLLKAGRVFTADQFAGSPVEADTEDIVGRDMFVALVNATYGLTGVKQVPATAPGGAPIRIVKEVEDHFKLLDPTDPEFDHYQPAAYLVSTNGVGLPNYDLALDRFQELFEQINAVL